MASSEVNLVIRLSLLATLLLGFMQSACAEVPRSEHPIVAQRVPMHAARYVPIGLPPQDRLRNAFLTTFGVVWFFWLGAALGSYLNVVVYRMPLGIASVAPDSRCPNCKTPIRWYDNIPVFSWLNLHGRCRACQTPISPRYVLVEVVIGGLFVLLLCAEVLTGGANLPVRDVRGYSGMPMIEYLMQWDLLATFAYHATLAWFVAGIVMFAMDGNSVPRAFSITAFLFIMLPPIFWPELRPVPIWQPLPAAGFRNGIVDGLAGVAGGIVIGFVLSFGANPRQHARWMPTIALLGALIGGALGWHATLIWFALAAVAWLFSRMVVISTGTVPGVSLMTISSIALLALLIGWNGFYEWYPPPETLFKRPTVNYLLIAVILPVLPLTIARYLDECLSSPNGSQPVLLSETAVARHAVTTSADESFDPESPTQT